MCILCLSLYLFSFDDTVFPLLILTVMTVRVLLTVVFLVTPVLFTFCYTYRYVLF